MAKTRSTAKRTKKPKRVSLREMQATGRGRIQARYDAAVLTDDNRRHWGNADDLNAVDAHSPDVRLKLRRHARYEFANNGYCRGMGVTLADFIVGRGPRLNIDSADFPEAQNVEREFMAWAKATRLGAKLRIGRLAIYHTGEAFLQFVTNPAVRHPVKLDIALVESDRVQSPWNGRERDGEIDGITYDTLGNPVSYRVMEEDTLGSYQVKASDMLHWFLPTRPGELRGIPELTPSLHPFADLRRFTEATIAAAETAAETAMVLQTTNPAQSDEAPTPMETVELEKRMATVLPDGYQLGQVKAEHPNTVYDTFVRAKLNEAARPFNMPLNIALCNSSGYNYASGNLDHSTFWKSVRNQQEDLGADILDRIFAAWLAEARRIAGYLDIGPDDTFEHEWYFDPREHADPTKVANSRDTSLKNGSKTLREIAAEDGVDEEARWAQFEKEYRRAKSLGLPWPPGSSAKPEEPDDDDGGEGQPGEEDGNEE